MFCKVSSGFITAISGARRGVACGLVACFVVGVDIIILLGNSLLFYS